MKFSNVYFSVISVGAVAACGVKATANLREHEPHWYQRSFFGTSGGVTSAVVTSPQKTQGGLLVGW
jgi:hypothetical protein